MTRFRFLRKMLPGTAGPEVLGVVLWSGCTLSGLDELTGGATETNRFDAGGGGMDSGRPDTGTDPGEDAAMADAGSDAGAADAGADSGPAHDACAPVPTDHKRVFVTSESFAGPLDGVVAADLRCRNLADALCLGGEWRAWLSATNNSAALRFTHATVPYRLLNGTQVADNWADLIDGSLDAPINLDEHGEQVADGTVRVWTGTTTAGNTFTDRHCMNWTSGGADYAKYGNPTSASFAWSAEHDIVCANSARLYCFEQ